MMGPPPNSKVIGVSTAPTTQGAVLPDHPTTVEEYIRSFPDDVQIILHNVRKTILDKVPNAGEIISYQIPTVTMDGTALVYFAGWSKHIALYPVPDGDEAFERAVAPYRAARSTVRFPLGTPIPYDVIGRITALLVRQRQYPG